MGDNGSEIPVRAKCRQPEYGIDGGNPQSMGLINSYTYNE